MNNILFNIYMAIVFIIPGFIIICITERIIPKEKTEYNLKILDFFIYSFINMLFWGIPLFNIILNFNWWINNYIYLWLLIILITIISPICISLIIICLKKYEILRRICKYFEINLIEPEPSAWDYKFSNMKSEWVIVTLTDNSVIAGFMGSLSCASSSRDERDLYINEIYTIDENNNWNIVKNTDGILIKEQNIKHIEFIKKEEDNINEKK